jgi:biopolymer transport protein ExbB
MRLLTQCCRLRCAGAAAFILCLSLFNTTSAFAQPAAAGPDTAVAESEARSAVPTSPREMVEAIGYPFAVVFAAASIVALWSAIERLVLLRRRRVIPRAFVDRFLMHLRTGRMDKPNAVAVCQQNGSPVAEVFLHGIRKWGKPGVEIEQAVMDGGERQVALLKRRLRVLNGVATIMPLIGLLGTVTGMIEAFNNIADSNAMGQAEMLASGIALALLTTAIGLFIAIPALTAYMYLAGRIDALVVEMDRLGQEVVHLISAESLRERGESPAPQKKRPTTTGAKQQPPGES